MPRINIIIVLTGHLMLTGLSSAVSADSLKPFRSDGCSSFPDGTIRQNTLWLRCCYQHDLSYWQGGTELQRMVADYDLQHCVNSVGEPTIAKLMLAGVRAGGSPYFPTPYRWGYGWSYLRGYKALNATEQMQVKQILIKAPSPISP
jgi:hypothetical protein